MSTAKDYWVGFAQTNFMGINDEVADGIEAI